MLALSNMMAIHNLNLISSKQLTIAILQWFLFDNLLFLSSRHDLRIVWLRICGNLTSASQQYSFIVLILHILQLHTSSAQVQVTANRKVLIFLWFTLCVLTKLLLLVDVGVGQSIIVLTALLLMFVAGLWSIDLSRLLEVNLSLYCLLVFWILIVMCELTVRVLWYWHGRRDMRKNLIFGQAGQLTLGYGSIFIVTAVDDWVLIVIGFCLGANLILVRDVLFLNFSPVVAHIHMLGLVPLEYLLLVLHDIWKVLSPTIEWRAEQIILLFLLAFVVREDFVARFGALCQNHLTVKDVWVNHQWVWWALSGAGR